MNANYLMIQLNRKIAFFSPADKGATGWLKCYIPEQFQKTIESAATYTTYTPVAIWKIKLK